jgi:hypothetical protein
VCPEVFCLEPHDDNDTATLAGITAHWLEAAAYGWVCNDLDGHDVLALYGWLPPMEPELEELVDRLLIRPIVEWQPPIVAALRRRERAGTPAPLDADQVARILAWSARHCERSARRWKALVALVAASGGSRERFERLFDDEGEDLAEPGMWSGAVADPLRFVVTQVEPFDGFWQP